MDKTKQILEILEKAKEPIPVYHFVIIGIASDMVEAKNLVLSLNVETNDQGYCLHGRLKLWHDEQHSATSEAELKQRADFRYGYANE